MYQNYFGFNEKPFSITPDPRFLYLSEPHREGLAHLLFGTDESGSFVLLTGEVGTGKTTLCRALLDEAPDGARFALILNPLQAPLELLASICDEFGVEYPKPATSRKALVDRLNRFLLDIHAKGERAVLIIDEAQNLDPLTLEQIRLLTNLETRAHKLLKIVLIGQPELKQMLGRSELRQLAQRITARYHLNPLSLDETAQYVAHRLRVAGVAREVFKPSGLRMLHRLSRGIPRVINVIGDRALIGAYAKGRDSINGALVYRAATEVRGELPESPLGWRALSAAAVALVLLASAGWMGYRAYQGDVAVGLVAARVEQRVASESNDLPTPSASAQVTEVDASELGLRLVRAQPAEAVYRELFARWGIEQGTLEGDSVCARAQYAGLRCLAGRGDLETLRALNLVAVLELHNVALERRLALLDSVDGERWTLRLADTRIGVSAAALDPYWLGEFLLLWRPPPNGAEVLKQGDTGLDVVWLRRQLDRADGIDLPLRAYSNVFDRALVERVKQFQSDNALTPDGVAGERTLLRLAAVGANPNVPTLSATDQE
ncbi:MAG: AAA family ATPase [Thiotrichales bacterium]